MTTIETTAVVSRGRRLSVDTTAPADLPAGQHRAILVIQDQPEGSGQAHVPLPLHDAALTPPDLSLRREDIYGET